MRTAKQEHPLNTRKPTFTRLVPEAKPADLYRDVQELVGKRYFPYVEGDNSIDTRSVTRILGNQMVMTLVASKPCFVLYPFGHDNTLNYKDTVVDLIVGETAQPCRFYRDKDGIHKIVLSEPQLDKPVYSCTANLELA